jgi:hypothetical protein
MKRILTAVTLGVVSTAGVALLASAGGQDFDLKYWLRGWPTFGQNPQHVGRGPAPSQPLNTIHWQTPVDLNPQYSGPYLLIHYGSPLITPRNNVLITVKTGATGGFKVDCRKGSDGTLIYSQSTDYTLPSTSGWTPLVGPTLTPQNSLAIPAIGGTILKRASADKAGIPAVRQCFYGLATYNSAQATYNSAIKITSPIVSDSRGNLFFTFSASTNPAGLVGGIARMDKNGNGIWTSGATASGDAAITRCPLNSAPCLSNDEQVLYVATRNSNSRGYLLGLNSTTLAPLYKVRVKDPATTNDANLSDSGTASPCVCPDDEVLFGVLENPGGSNNSRGWLLHFNKTLTTTLTPGAFGWDHTPSTVPASCVPQYGGSSTYLVVTKYNNYASSLGNGQNKVAVLDPHATQIDAITGATVMKEVITKVGPTPDPPNGPNAVREWCINALAVDVASKVAIVNNEDGKVYRWDFPTNNLGPGIVLTPGIGEAYTPTVLGPDGQSYAINNAILFACGQ